MSETKQDWSRLNNFCKELDLDLEELLDTYFRQAETHNKQLSDGITAQDFDTIKSNSHKMIGSSSSLYFDSLSLWYREMNQASLSNDLIKCNELMEQILIETESIKQEAKLYKF